MIYLDNGATSFHKPPEVHSAVRRAMLRCANPGRGGYQEAKNALDEVFLCRETAARMFGCEPQQVVFTSNCTHGLNIAIGSLVKPGGRVVISGFEHNAVTRPLHMRQARIVVAGRQLFGASQMLEELEKALRSGVDAAVFTHVSNVFGYILPIEDMAALCKRYGVPFMIDAAQSAGVLPVDLKKLGADFIAMPGHKGLLGPQGTGILLCAGNAVPLLAGGTGSESKQQQMPELLPERLEAGTLNVPGIAGLRAGMEWVGRIGLPQILRKERAAVCFCANKLEEMGVRVFSGEEQTGTLSFLPDDDCEEIAQYLAEHGVAVRAGLHCAPLAHESAGTLQTGTVRISFGHDASISQAICLCRLLERYQTKKVSVSYCYPGQNPL